MDKTNTDPAFAAIQNDKCPIRLLELIKAKCTGAQSGVWAPLAAMHQLGTTISFHQKLKQGEGLSTGDFKRTVESYIATVWKTGGMFTFGTIYYEPFLTDAGEPIATYVAMNEEQRQPLDIQVQDKLVAILKIKSCIYSGIRKCLAQQ